MGRQPELASWRTLHSREIHDGSPWLRLTQETIELPDGRIVEGFYTLDMPDYVVIVAIDCELRAIVTRSYKHGPGRVCINLPAGFLECNEDPLEGAKRELIEETGYVAERWEPLGSFTCDGNRGAGTGHLYLARDCRNIQDPDSGDLEEMLVELTPFHDLVEATFTGNVAVLGNAAAIGLAAARLSLPGND